MTDTIAPIDYYARHGAALFPIPAGEKAPTGIVASFKHDYSRDPAQWEKWAIEHRCNFGVVAFASNWIILDIDTKESRDASWALWCELCASWGIAVLKPQVQSASGGWHVYRPLANLDAEIRGIELHEWLLIRASRGFLLAQPPKANDRRRDGARLVLIADKVLQRELATAVYEKPFAIGGVKDFDDNAV